MSGRLEFVELAQGASANVALLCRRFGITRKTGYKWLARYRDGGAAALADRSRRPHQSPRRTGPEVEQRIVELRQRHRAWGGRKRAARLQALAAPAVPAPSTITAVLRRHGLLDLRRAEAHQACQRFEYQQPNELWQMDFKGHIALQAGDAAIR